MDEKTEDYIPIFETAVDQNSKIINLWPTAVWKSNIGRNHDYVEQNYANSNNHKLEKLSTDNLRSSDTDIINKKPLVNIRSFVLSELNRYLSITINPLSNLEIYFTQSWLSFTRENQDHHSHFHSNSFLTAVYYLIAEDGTDSISILNNAYTFNNRHLIHLDNTPTWWTSKTISIPVKSGDLIIFPSFIDHAVAPVKKNSHYRVSISMNTWFRGEIGLEKNLNKITFV
jgi:hypothetical protein